MVIILLFYGSLGIAYLFLQFQGSINLLCQIPNLFSSEERVLIIKNSLFKDLKFSKNKLKILSFNTLTTTLCTKHNATIIFRGLRATSDFEYEFQLAGMNRQLNKKIETVFLMSDPDKQVISSKFVKEIAKLKGKIDDFVTKSTKKSLKDKYE